MLLPCGASRSWALFFCYDANSTAMKTALQQCSLPPILVGGMMQSPAFFNRQARVLAPHVDNGRNLIALTSKVFTAEVAELRL